MREKPRSMKEDDLEPDLPNPVLWETVELLLLNSLFIL